MSSPNDRLQHPIKVEIDECRPDHSLVMLQTSCETWTSIKDANCGLIRLWGGYAPTNAKHVALIDQMDRDACKDHYVHRSFAESIDRSTTQTRGLGGVKAAHDVDVFSIATICRYAGNSEHRLPQSSQMCSSSYTL